MKIKLILGILIAAMITMATMTTANAWAISNTYPTVLNENSQTGAWSDVTNAITGDFLSDGGGNHYTFADASTFTGAEDISAVFYIKTPVDFVDAANDGNNAEAMFGWFNDGAMGTNFIGAKIISTVASDGAVEIVAYAIDNAGTPYTTTGTANAILADTEYEIQISFDGGGNDDLIVKVVDSATGIAADTVTETGMTNPVFVAVSDVGIGASIVGAEAFNNDFTLRGVVAVDGPALTGGTISLQENQDTPYQIEIDTLGSGAYTGELLTGQVTAFIELANGDLIASFDIDYDALIAQPDAATDVFILGATSVGTSTFWLDQETTSGFETAFFHPGKTWAADQVGWGTYVSNAWLYVPKDGAAVAPYYCSLLIGEYVDWTAFNAAGGAGGTINSLCGGYDTNPTWQEGPTGVTYSFGSKDTFQVTNGGGGSQTPAVPEFSDLGWILAGVLGAGGFFIASRRRKSF